MQGREQPRMRCRPMAAPAGVGTHAHFLHWDGGTELPGGKPHSVTGTICKHHTYRAMIYSGDVNSGLCVRQQPSPPLPTVSHGI